MNFIETKLKGVYIIEPERIRDNRGFNARAWDGETFKAQGLDPRVVQVNIIYNGSGGTLRGLHYQEPPRAQNKLFRCVRGAMHDVVVDMRPESPTYGHWTSVELTAENYRQLYIPERCAQGFQTLEDDTEVVYQVTDVHAPECERGIRYDDPEFGIEWPLEVTVISEKDKNWPGIKL